MGGSSIIGGGGGGKGAVQTLPAPVPLPEEPGSGEDATRIQEARRREAERLRRLAGATVATAEGGVLGSAQVGRKTLG